MASDETEITCSCLGCIVLLIAIIGGVAVLAKWSQFCWQWVMG